MNFLDKKFCRFFVKLLSRFFRRLLFNYYYFFFFKNNVFGCKFRAALATTSRRPLRNAVIPARDGNAELITKKSSCLLYVRLQSFHDNTELIMNSSCMSFGKLPRHPLWRTYQWLFYRASKSSIVINVLVVLRQVLGLMQFIIFRHIFVLKGFLLLMSWDPVASLNFPLEKSTAGFSRCSGILLAGSEIGKSKGIELSMGSTVTIKDMTTLEEFILINTLHQCQSIWTSPSKIINNQSTSLDVQKFSYY